MANITFVYPRKTLPLSITGNGCALNCAHCKGHYLRHMKEVLLDTDVPEEDINSYLVSGGCDSEGAVPLKDHVDLLRELSKRRKVIAHTGLIKKDDVPIISPYLFAASFNLIGDDSTIKEIYNLDKTTEDFMDCYSELRRHVKTFPHITIGLHMGAVKGEHNAIDMLSSIGADAVVFNVFIPTTGTDFEALEPPSLDAVKEVISYAGQKMDGTKLFLGCMRPGGSYREKLDAFCVEAGFDRMVMPSKSARRLAESLNYEISKSEECCII